MKESIGEKRERGGWKGGELREILEEIKGLKG